jgi:hypothetical protein
MHDENRVRTTFYETSERYLTAGKQHSQVADPADECLYCGKPMPEYGQWCDTECRNRWKESRALRK